MALRRWIAVLLAAAGTSFSPAPAAAQDREEILSFDVAIDVRPGGSMVVTEAIQVRALGNQIKRGIFRDFPTSFPRGFGLARIEAPFTVLSVTRDGAAETYRIESIGDGMGRGGVRVRIGQANVLLNSGVYLYEIVYETDRWVRFGDEQDELYWNVTGNGWSFPILSASARVRVLEAGTEPTLETWTGPEGSQSTMAIGVWNEDERTAEFETGDRLGARAGLTVRLTLPSGELTPPSEAQQEEWFALDWGGYIDAGYVVLFVIAIYLLMWRQVGIDPAKGLTKMRREPPDGYSPAALGYIEARGYDQSQLSAALVSLALKGALRIEQDGKTWVLHKLADEPEGLSQEEAQLFNGLLAGRSRIELKQTHHAVLRPAIKLFRKSLAVRLEKEYFANNRRWFALGVILSVLAFAALAWRWRFDVNPVAWFLGLWLTGWTVGVGTLGYRLLQMLRTARATSSPIQWTAFLALGLFATPFFIAEGVVAAILFTMMSSHLVFAAILIGGTNILFYHLLERPTLKGRGVLDQLEGFRSYLEGSDRENALPTTDDQVALFERHLPFAIALGLADRWTEAFSGVLAPLFAGSSAGNRLHWYDHGHGNFHAGSFSSALGSSLGSTLSSSSAAPASSGGGGGGGGGGGSSGGGGGGGGGGGW